MHIAQTGKHNSTTDKKQLQVFKLASNSYEAATRHLHKNIVVTLSRLWTADSKVENSTLTTMGN